MKKRLLSTALSIALVALPLNTLGANAAWAVEPAGRSFCPGGIRSNEELARKLDASLAADPSGNRRLQGCNANAMQFLVAFQEADPDEGLANVSQLPAYVRRLTPMEVDRTIEHRTSCLQERPGGVVAVVMACVTREVRAGETIYGNPRTGAKVLWSGCANPGFSPSLDITIVAENCIRVRAPTGPVGTRLRAAYIGPRLLSSRCHALQLSSWEERVYDFPEECPMGVREREGQLVPIVCEWTNIERNSTRVMGQPMFVQNVSWSIHVDQGEVGYVDWWLPLDALDGLPTWCWEYPDGQVIALSVGRDSFRDGVAVVTEADVRGAVWRR